MGYNYNYYCYHSSIPYYPKVGHNKFVRYQALTLNSIRNLARSLITCEARVFRQSSVPGDCGAEVLPALLTLMGV